MAVRLTGPLPAWDVCRRSAPVGPFIEWLLQRCRARGYEVESLAQLHRVLTPFEAVALSAALSFEASERPGFDLLRQLLKRALPEVPWRAVALQATPHVRILIPGDAVSPVAPHTDFEAGRSLEERNLWVALTAARGTAALCLAPWAQSRALMQALGSPLPVSLELPRVEADVGDVLLFTPLHAHRAQTVQEEVTRVSLDVRIMPLELVRDRAQSDFVPMEPRS
jgi:hypothetical protein